MKLLFVLFKYFPFGGMQRDFLRIAKVCQQRGHDIEVLTLKWQGDHPEGFKITIVPKIKNSNYARYSAFAAFMQNYAIKNNIDRIIGFNKMPGLDIYFAADQCYASKCQQRWWWHRVSQRYKILSYFERRIFQKGLATHIFTLTKAQQDGYQNYYHTETQRFHLLPPGISRDRLLFNDPAPGLSPQILDPQRHPRDPSDRHLRESGNPYSREPSATQKNISLFPDESLEYGSPLSRGRRLPCKTLPDTDTHPRDPSDRHSRKSGNPYSREPSATQKNISLFPDEPLRNTCPGEGRDGSRPSPGRRLAKKILPNVNTEVTQNQHKHKVLTELNIPHDAHIILLAGSGFKTKGVDRALYAIASLPAKIRKQTHFIILGQDNPKPFVRLATKLKLIKQTHFLGGRSDILNFFSAADLLLHPAYFETAGHVLLEAMAAGLPVLTTAACGYSYYIETAKAGIVIQEPFQQNQCNDLLLHMLTSDNKPQWQSNGRAFVQNNDLFSLPEVAAELIEQIKLENPTSSLTLANISGTKKDNFTFDAIMNLSGRIYREQSGRRTLKFALNNKNYFAKLHFGVGWPEIFKNLFQFRLPIIGAKPEWQALQRMHALQIPTMQLIGFGARGLNPATRQSYIITEELTNCISLEDYCAHWHTQPPQFKHKLALLEQVARLARNLHQNGINHRDFYLCHILLDQQSTENTNATPSLYLIDCHRAQLRKQTPERWLIKDIASLYYSAMHIGLTKRDLLRFIAIYWQMPLRQALADKYFWQQVQAKADKLNTKAQRYLTNAMSGI